MIKPSFAVEFSISKKNTDSCLSSSSLKTGILYELVLLGEVLFMSLSVCHYKHRPAFVCIRSLCNHCEGCGALQKAAQARALSARVGSGYG